MYSVSLNAPMTQTTTVVNAMVGNRSMRGRTKSNTRLFKPCVGPTAKVLYAKGTAMISSSGGCTMAVNSDLFWTISTAATQPMKNITLKNMVSSEPAISSIR